MIQALTDKEQAKERHKFVNWFFDYFTCRPHKAYRNSVTLDELYTLYTIFYPNTCLTEVEVGDIFKIAGIITAYKPTLDVDPNLKNIAQLTPEQIIIFNKLPWNKGHKDNIIKLSHTRERSDMLISKGYGPEACDGKTGVILDDIYNRFCIDTRNFPSPDNIPSSYKKAPIKYIKLLFNIYCSTYGVHGIEFRMFKDYLIWKGHTSGNGYACKQAGQSYLRWLYVPEPTYSLDVVETIELGNIIVHFGEHWCDKEGKPVTYQGGEMTEGQSPSATTETIKASEVKRTNEVNMTLPITAADTKEHFDASLTDLHEVLIPVNNDTDIIEIAKTTGKAQEDIAIDSAKLNSGALITDADPGLGISKSANPIGLSKSDLASFSNPTAMEKMLKNIGMSMDDVDAALKSQKQEDQEKQ